MRHTELSKRYQVKWISLLALVSQPFCFSVPRSFTLFQSVRSAKENLPPSRSAL